MKFNKILVTGFDKSGLDVQTWRQISNLANKIVLSPEDGIDCLLCKFNPVTKDVINSLSDLKYIGLLATGYGTVDVECAKQKKITVCNIPGYSTESVA